MVKIVTFDFDKTLAYDDGTPRNCMVEMMIFHAERGDECHIVTSRTHSHEEDGWIAKHEPGRMTVKRFVEKYSLPVRSISYTAHEPKGPTLKLMGAFMHYDNERIEVESAANHGVVGVLVSSCD